MGKKKADQKTGRAVLTFTVAECGEYTALENTMRALCNLSQGIRDNTLVDVIMTMYENNFTLEQIAVATKKA